jgi:predicted O-methyltransferase YrrM
LGTLGGYSTAWLAKSLPSDGYLISLELERKHAELARENLERLSLPCQIDITVGDAIQSLKKLHESKVQAFDLIFIDADKSQYPDYLDWCIKLSRKGTMIIADNMVREGAVIDERSEDLSVQGVRRFNAMVSGDPRLQATAIQTVGAKGYDGFCLIYVDA